MSILNRIVAILLISLLAIAPGLASASAPSQPSCDMAGMHHEMGSAGTTSKALAAICKVKCQAPAMMPQPDIVSREISLNSVFLQNAFTAMSSLSTPPESPPPRR